MPRSVLLSRTGLDTLFAVAWADLEKEPLVLSVPDTNGRYYVIALFRYVEQRFHVFRQAQHRHRRSKLSNFGTWLAGHAASRRQTSFPLSNALRVGERPDASGRPEGLRRGERAATPIQTYASQLLGKALRTARGCTACQSGGLENPAAHASTADGRQRFLRAACPPDERQSSCRCRRPDGRETPQTRHRARERF